MKNIYFVQACDVHGTRGHESAYLPYATGLLAAYAFHNDTVKKNYEVKRFIYRKESVAAAVRGMESPAVVGFSTYLWNYEYNLAFAKEVKRVYPECVVVFGGHSVSNRTPEMLERFPFIDFLIHGEGEIAFCEILTALCGDRDFSGIANISYRDENGRARMNEAKPICEIDYPSPYLEGWFDDMIANDDIEFSALLETNRGCPFHCAYCDWGSIQLRMRQFPLERVAAELRYFAEKKIRFCFCIDSNFGMFPRDFEIVDRFIKIKEETGYPEMFKCCTTEGGGMAEFNINKKLNDLHLLKGASLALQTLSEDALKNIGRRNMSIKRYGELTALYNEAGIPTYSELIYGLPGETYDSFASNLSFMLESGTTRGCFIHYCELLPNAALSIPENIERFAIRTARIPYTQFHTDPDAEITEYSNIIISTYSMDYEMWVRACVFGLYVQCFHYMGILQHFSKYLHYEKQLSYRDFYEALIAFAEHEPDTLLGRYHAFMTGNLGALRRGEQITRSYVNPLFGNIDWPMEEGMCLEILNDRNRFFDEIASFLLSFGPDDPVLPELISFQRAMLRTPFAADETHTYRYDFYGYFRDIDTAGYRPLREARNTLTFADRAKTESLTEYATKIVWYGRKSAKTMFSGEEITQRFDATVG